MYVKVNDGAVQVYPYSIDQLRADNPNTSFPNEPSEESLAGWSVFPVEHQAQPDYDNETQRIEHSNEPVLVDDKWVITKTVVNLTDEQIAANQASRDLGAANKARRKRNDLLAETDWMGMSDVTMSADWATYRQALRDVPAQAGFPHTIDWPSKPE